MANIPLKTIKFPGLDDTYTVPQVDNTLSVTGAAADAKKTGDELTELNERIDNALGEGETLVALQYTQTGYYIPLDGTTVDLNNPVSSTFGHAYIVADCQEGDRFVVNAKGGARPRAWGFINSQNTIIDVAETGVTVENLRLTAPAGATKLIINDNSNPNKTSYRVTEEGSAGIVVRVDTEQDFTDAQKEQARENLGISSSADTDVLMPIPVARTLHYIDLSGSTANLAGPLYSNEYSYSFIECNANDTFIINTTGGSNARAWGIINSENEIIAVADANVTVTNLRLTAPVGAKYLIINNSTQSVSYAVHTMSEFVRYDYLQNKSLQEKTKACENLGIYNRQEVTFNYNQYLYDGPDIPVGGVVDLTDLKTSVWYKYAIIECSGGDIFVLSVIGGGASRAWCFVDADNKKISVADANTALEDYYIQAPENAEKLIINDKYRANENDNVSTGGTVYKIIGNISSNGLSDVAREALLDCFKNVLWEDDDSNTYYLALKNALRQ